MNWVRALYDLYEKNTHLAGEMKSIKRGDTDIPLILLPVSHTTALAQIEITIDMDGNFMSARRLSKEEGLTPIPVTEKSASRANAPATHALHDKLIYVAADYSESLMLEGKEKTRADECSLLYIEALENWCHSVFSHPKAIAVYKYIIKKCVMADLLTNGILKTDENDNISVKDKIQIVVQTDAFVRFSVLVRNNFDETIISDLNHIYDNNTWMDKELQKNFIDYFYTQLPEERLCYLNGDSVRPASLTTRKIRNEGDGSKLISANDDTNYTFRGRFDEKDEAFSIGYYTSQKAHNALKWIIRKQGYTRDGLCFVTWENSLKQIPEPYGDALDLAGLGYDEDDDSEQDIYDTNYRNADSFRKSITGYRRELDDNSRMFILSLDSATPGRLAMTYFKELETSRYLDNLEYWHESCKWHHMRFVDKKPVFYEGMTGLKEVAEALYGTEQGGFLKVRSVGDRSPLISSTFDRLLPCVLERAPVPFDMVRTAVTKASNPLAYENAYERVLSVACSLVRKYYYDKAMKKIKDGMVLEMKLDKSISDRSYLYGRLLAVAEKIERRTYEREEERITNAERYMQSFSQRPFRTWGIIRRNLQPYFGALSTKDREYYKNLLGEITDQFEYQDYASDAALDGKYLVGYDCQRTALKWKAKEAEELTPEQDNK